MTGEQVFLRTTGHSSEKRKRVYVFRLRFAFLLAIFRRSGLTNARNAATIRGRRAVVWSYGRAGVRSCGRAVVQSCTRERERKLVRIDPCGLKSQLDRS